MKRKCINKNNSKMFPLSVIGSESTVNCMNIKRNKSNKKTSFIHN